MNHKLTKYFIGSLLSLSSFAWAGAAHDLLKADLSKNVKTLNRDTNMYHYFNLKNSFKNVADTLKNIEDTPLGNYRGRQDFILDRMATSAKGFRNFNQEYANWVQAGPGFYMATDPFASSPAAAIDTKAAFGSDLIEIKFRAGSKYLNAYAPLTLSGGTVNALIAEGYLRSDLVNKILPSRQFSSDTLKVMTAPAYIKFRKLVADLMLEMNVILVEYRWQSATGPLCDWKSGLDSAFVYISESIPQEVGEVNLINLYGFPPAMGLTSSEQDSNQRNQKLYQLLKILRDLDKKKSGSFGLFSSGKVKKEGARQTNAYFPDAAELRKIREQTFKCL